MEYVDPIKDIEKINAIKDKLKNHSQRDLLLFVLGINTGIRISDLLALKVGDVWDGEKVREFLYIKEDQEKAYYINRSVKSEIEIYLAKDDYKDEDFLFKSKKDLKPITRQQAYRIIHNAAKEVGVVEKVGTHTLRKTFGYHAYRKGIAISLLMSIYNHHSPAETLRYLGIDKKDEKLIKIDVNL